MSAQTPVRRSSRINRRAGSVESDTPAPVAAARTTGPRQTGARRARSTTPVPEVEVEVTTKKNQSKHSHAYGDPGSEGMPKDLNPATANEDAITAFTGAVSSARHHSKSPSAGHEIAGSTGAGPSGRRALGTVAEESEEQEEEGSSLFRIAVATKKTGLFRNKANGTSSSSSSATINNAKSDTSEENKPADEAAVKKTSNVKAGKVLAKETGKGKKPDNGNLDEDFSNLLASSSNAATARKASPSDAFNLNADIGSTGSPAFVEYTPARPSFNPKRNTRATSEPVEIRSPSDNTAPYKGKRTLHPLHETPIFSNNAGTNDGAIHIPGIRNVADAGNSLRKIISTIATRAWSLWSLISSLLLLLLVLSSTYQKLSPPLPYVKYFDLSRFSFITPAPHPTVNHTGNKFTVEAGISPWQFDHLASRINKLETSLHSISRDTGTPLRRINFFAPASGVLVDPYLTSPTRPLMLSGRSLPPAPRTFTDMLFGRKVSSLFPKTGFGPSSVFQAWEDAGECWCAPESAGGKSQIAVILPRRIVPQELVVEHIPETATLEAAAMPKDLELWVQIENASQRSAVAMASLDALDTPSPSPFAAQTSDIADEFGARRSLDETWIRIGKWRFERNGGAVQAFSMQVKLEELGVPIGKVAVRTTSSWGEAKHVCLYRLKLHGLVAEEVLVSA